MLARRRWSVPSAPQNADGECCERGGADRGVRALEQAALSGGAVQCIADDEREDEHRHPADRSGARANIFIASARSMSPANGRSWCPSVRTMSASMCASAAPAFPEAGHNQRVQRTVHPAASSAITHGPRSVSIPTTTSVSSVSAASPSCSARPAELLGDHPVQPGHPGHALRQPRPGRPFAALVHQLHIVVGPARSAVPGLLPARFSAPPSRTGRAGWPRIRLSTSPAGRDCSSPCAGPWGRDGGAPGSVARCAHRSGLNKTTSLSCGHQVG